MEQPRGWAIPAVMALVAVTTLLALWIFVWAPPPPPGPSGCQANCPLGVAVGPAIEQSQHGSNWYNFSVLSAGGGPQWGSIQFEVQTASGGSVTPDSHWLIQINQSRNFTVAVYNPSSGGWNLGYATPIRNDQTIVLFTDTTDLSSRGDVFVLLGVGSYAGSVSAAIP